MSLHKHLQLLHKNLLSVDCHHHGASFRVEVSGFELLSSDRIHLVLFVFLCVALEKLVCQLRMIDDDLLFSHVLDGFVCVALDGLLYWLTSMPRRPQVVKLSGWGRWPRPWCCIASRMYSMPILRNFFSLILLGLGQIS